LAYNLDLEDKIDHSFPEKAEELLKSEYVTPFDINGKPMKGWVLVSPDVLESDDKLMRMLRSGIGFAETLPKK
jgi:hypothetical protein